MKSRHGQDRFECVEAPGRIWAMYNNQSNQISRKLKPRYDP